MIEPDTEASMAAVELCTNHHGDDLPYLCPTVQRAIVADCRRYALAVLREALSMGNSGVTGYVSAMQAMIIELEGAGDA